ncbi:MAG: CbtB-domain containing protein [Paracoccaceae bacterium]|jgi:cobalt transporter subunit CbtB|nr:CbtB-domain containing protein [Paracoccaceae bacterium]
MTTKALNVSAVRTSMAPALFAAVLGFFIVAVAGHVQAGALHDAAHDVRHATGFPCH